MYEDTCNSMEPQLLIAWQQEKVDLKQEVCRLQEELAEGRAERQELESRCSALRERLCQSVSPSLVLQVEEEQRQFRKQMREGREREARQALLIHRLQNKVMEYRERCQHLEHQLLEHNHQINIERRTRDEDCATLESALIQLEEVKQRSINLADRNNLLHDDLSQSEQVILYLREDLKKLTSDWTTVMKEMGQRKSEHYLGLVDEQQSQFLSVWRSVVALKQHCQRLKTSTDRDLWKLRAEFFGISSSILSSCVSASCSLGLGQLPSKIPSSSPALVPHFSSSSTLISCNLTLSPPDTSSGVHPLLSSSLGRLAARELEHHEEENDSVGRKGEELQDKMKQQEILELKHLHEEAVFQLNERVSELSAEKEQQAERHRETERKLVSVSQAILKLSRILNSNSKSRNIYFSDGFFSLDLSGMLSVLSHSESALQRMHEELQRVELTVRQLTEEKSALELCLKQLEADKEQLCTDAQHTQKELKHTLDMLSSERDTSSSLRQQVEEVLQRQKEVKTEMDRLKMERARQDERKNQLETQIQKRTEAEMLENVQLNEREALHCLEIHSLKGALERQQFDRHRAEEDVRNALQKSRKCVLDLSSSESVLRYELLEGQNCLDQLAVINSALLLDKRELNRQLLEAEHELLDSQSQLELLRSEVSCLQTDVKNLNQDCIELRAHTKSETSVIHQLREKESEMEEIMEEKEKLLENMVKEREREKSQLEEVSSQHVIVYRQLMDVQQQLHTMTKEMKKQDGQEEEYQRENQRSKEECVNLERYNKHLEEELQELRSLLLPLQQQLSQQQHHLSEMELDRIHMSRHIQTLQEAKRTLQGEMECLRGELEEETCKRKSENEHRQRTEEEKGVLFEEKQQLQEQLEELRRRRREEEEEKSSKDREKWKKEQEVLNEELGMRNEELASLRRHIEGQTKEREAIEKDMVKLINLVNRTGETKQMHKAETEMDRWKRIVEVVQEEIDNLRVEISTLMEDRDKQNRLTQELQKQCEENVRRKEEELKNLREEINRAEKDVKRLKEVVAEMELLRVDLNVAKEECKGLKEVLEQREHSLEQQMSNVRKREGEEEEVIEQETALKYQELKQKFKVTQVKIKRLEESLQETQAVLTEERRKSGEKDIRMSLQAKELQEACALSREVTLKLREKEVAVDRLEKEMKEWREKSENIQREAGELKLLQKDTKEQVLQLTATLQEHQETPRVRDKLEIEQELDKRWERMEDEMKVTSVELKTKKNEVLVLTGERKEKQEAKTEFMRIQDVQPPKKEEEVQDVLKFRERLEEEERGSKTEMSLLQHEQIGKKKFQRDPVKMSDEVPVLREAVREEPRRGEELQEVVKEDMRKKKNKQQAELLHKEQEGKHGVQEEPINKRQELNTLHQELQKEKKIREEPQAELQKNKGVMNHLKEELQIERRRREEVQLELRRAQQNVVEANLSSQQVQATLIRGTEDVENDRRPLPLALDQNEADVITYKRRTHLQEQRVKMETNPDQHNVADRLVVLHRFVAQLELQEKQLKKRNSQLESQNESLKKGRDTLRDTLRKVEEERSSFKNQLTEINRFQKCTDAAHEEELRRKLRELEDQVSQLRHLLTEDHQQRAEFIQQSSQNSLSLLALRHNLTDSLAAVTRCPIPSVLETETQRLDCSLREEEFQMFLSQP